MPSKRGAQEAADGDGKRQRIRVSGVDRKNVNCGVLMMLLLVLSTLVRLTRYFSVAVV